MNRPIRKVAIAIAVLFVAMFVNLNVVQVIKGSDYRNNANNRRTILDEYSSPRGQIVAGGTAIAQSRKRHDELKYLRTYRDGPRYAQVTGYDSYIYGTDGMEATENDILSGDSPQLFTTKFADILTGRDPRGGSVQLTINKAAQRAAYDAMKLPDGTYRPGAIVALDPKTGAILASVSTPSYDPNVLSSHDSRSIQDAWACYNGPDTGQRVTETDRDLARRIAREIAAREPNQATGKKGCSNVPNDPTKFFKSDPTAPGPLVNRAFDVTYPPGSIFKVIVAAAALKAGLSPDDKIFAPQYYWPLQPGKRSACAIGDTGPCIHNFTLSDGEREQCEPGRNEATLDFALEKSCNTAFAALAVRELGVARIAAQARLFGLDTGGMRVPLRVAGSTIGSRTELRRDNVALAQTAFGQRSVSITPLQAAMISAAVANHGTLYKPYLVNRELRPNLSVLNETQPRQLSQVIDTGLDDELISMMENVVSGKEAGSSATGGAADITDLGPEVVVGGKTGTADHEDANGKALPAHSWFSGFAMVKSEPKIAVSVILEDSDATGGEDAAPKAKSVMEAYLRSIGTN